MRRQPAFAWRRWRTFGLVGLLLGAWVLAYFLPAPTASGATGTIRYSTAWEWGRAIPVEGGWQTTTDLGYTVTVTGGMLVNRAVTSAECPHSHSLLGWFLEAVLTPSASAGHGSEEAMLCHLANDAEMRVIGGRLHPA